MTVRVDAVAPAYDGWLKVKVATLVDAAGTRFTREVESHGDGVAVLPYDAERRTALLVTMPRAPPLVCGQSDWLIEVPAGLLDAGEAPQDAARREAAEETGVVLAGLESVGTVWSMPGISTERMHLFLAPYRAADRTGPGGGLAEEHETITVVELPLAELAALADRGALADMKTLALLLTLRVRHPALFDGP